MSGITGSEQHTAAWVLDVVRIANEAVAEAIAENKRYGIPEFFWKAGRLYYVTAEGELTTQRPSANVLNDPD